MRRLAPVVLLLAGMAACAGPEAPDNLPSDPAVLVLQVTELPSSPRPWERGQLPRFSLYGGGRVIVPAGGGDALRTAREYQLSADGYRDLMDRAYASRLDRSREVADPAQTDASLLVIKLRTPHGVRTTRITAPDAGGEARERIDTFVRRLPAVPADAATYQPAAIAVLATGGVGADPAARRWPFDPLGQGTRTRQGVCTVLAAAGPLEGLGQEASRWSSEGRVFAVVGRPLLPGEHACQDIDP